jgi:hypothetical protein
MFSKAPPPRSVNQKHFRFALDASPGHAILPS